MFMHRISFTVPLITYPGTVVRGLTGAYSPTRRWFSLPDGTDQNPLTQVLLAITQGATKVQLWLEHPQTGTAYLDEFTTLELLEP